MTTKHARPASRVASLAHHDGEAVVFIQQSTSMSSYPVHRSIPPTRRSKSDESLVPGEAQDKPLNPHANLSLLRAPRTVSNGLHCPC
jgi:hypothetical protein